MKNFIFNKSYFSKKAILVLILFPLVIAIICIAIGRLYIPVPKVVDTISKLILGKEIDAQLYSIIVNLRMPRIIMAMIVGAGLTCAGAAFQSLFSNPLATPDILGVTSGTCLGAIAAMLLSLDLVSVQLIGLVCGLFSVYITIKVAGDKENHSVVLLVLSGVIISALFNAIGAFLRYTADPTDKLPAITYWLMGSFSSSTYKKILIGTPLILIGIVMIFLLRWRLNVLSLSEDEAKSSGIELAKTRLWFIIASTFITASCVAMCGQVGWIGLLIPHLARMLVGSNNRYVIPLSISLGASAMIIIDTIARSIAKIEIPISIITAIVGAPVFISLLRKPKGGMS